MEFDLVYIKCDAFNQTEKLDVIYTSNSKYNHAPSDKNLCLIIDIVVEKGYDYRKIYSVYAPF